jgi:hypothetical protein
MEKNRQKALQNYYQSVAALNLQVHAYLSALDGIGDDEERYRAESLELIAQAGNIELAIRQLE